MDFKFKKSATDAYAVWLNGECIGEVQKAERRYNLRRLLVIKGWTARMNDGRTIKGNTESNIYSTRVKAADALKKEFYG